MYMPKLANGLLGDTARIAGPLTSGHYIQVGMGLGFYVPEEAFERVQALANTTGKVQFLGVTRTGAALLGTRDEILEHPHSAGLVAWIVPSSNSAQLDAASLTLYGRPYDELDADKQAELNEESKDWGPGGPTTCDLFERQDEASR